MRYYDLDGDACDVEPTSIAGNEYIFKGPWKQRFSPFATEDQRPAFFITDAEGTQTFPSQLVSMKGATDEPINEGTGAEGGVFANVLGDPLQLSCKIPIIDATVSLTLPLTEYLPKVTINPGGYVVIYVGSELLEDDFGEHDKTSWRIKDGKEYQREQKKKEAEGWFAKYKSDYDQAKDFAKTTGFGLIKQTDLMMGWFGVASGRWELDNSIPDILSKDISLRVGTGLTWTFTISYTVTYAIPPFAVPAYATVSLGISCGIGIEFTLEMSWVNGTFQTWKLFPLKNTTVDIGIILGVQVGVGIKGFLDAYVKVAASLDFIMNLSTADPSTAELDGGIDLTVGATVFFISASKTWHLASGRIWPSNSAANLLQHFMNAGDEEPEVQEAVHDEPFSYPALAAEAEEEAWTWRAQSEGYPFKIVDVNGFRFAFSIYKATGKDGKQHSRVGYCRINSDSDSFALVAATMT